VGTVMAAGGMQWLHATMSGCIGLQGKAALTGGDFGSGKHGETPFLLLETRLRG
jgi:hypothetical protein